MDELELVGLHDDGEHLVLARPGGGSFRLRIDEPLRAAVRRDRPQLEQLRAEGAGTLSPREIQTRIRAGATAQEVADASGLPVEHVRRYEGPVLAEREYVAEQARASRVGRDRDAPTLGDLVTDRLATRGVDPASLSWDAAREGTGPWMVLARFRVGDEEREARWTFDASARTVAADEDEARWLSETELDEATVPRRHLSAVRDVVFDFQGQHPTPREPEPAPEPSPEAATEQLLDDLRGRRGVRQAVDEEDDGEEFEGFGPQHAFDFARLEADVPGAHPADADPEQEARILVVPTAAPQPETEPEPEQDTERPRSRRGRAKVPSWDEIVFGARPE